MLRALTIAASVTVLVGCQSAYLAAKETCEASGWDSVKCTHAQNMARHEEDLREQRRRRLWATGVIMSTPRAY